MTDPTVEAATMLIAAFGTGTVWALIGWGNAWIKDEKFTLKKILRVELIALGAVVVGLVLHVTPEQGMNFFVLNGGIPMADKAVSFITSWINYKESVASPPSPPA